MALHLPVFSAACVAIIGLLAAFLTVRVILSRVRFKVDVGDGGHPELAQAIRAHGNLTEHAPITLLLIGLAEALQAPMMAIYALGGVLVLARLASAWGLGNSLGQSAGRQAGAGLTVLVTVLTSLLVLYKLATL